MKTSKMHNIMYYVGYCLLSDPSGTFRVVNFYDFLFYVWHATIGGYLDSSVGVRGLEIFTLSLA